MIKMVKSKTESYIQKDFNKNFLKKYNSCWLQVDTELSDTERAENF